MLWVLIRIILILHILYHIITIRLLILSSDKWGSFFAIALNLDRFNILRLAKQVRENNREETKLVNVGFRILPAFVVMLILWFGRVVVIECRLAIDDACNVPEWTWYSTNT